MTPQNHRGPEIKRIIREKLGIETGVRVNEYPADVQQQYAQLMAHMIQTLELTDDERGWLTRSLIASVGRELAAEHGVGRVRVEHEEPPESPSGNGLLPPSWGTIGTAGDGPHSEESIDALLTRLGAQDIHTIDSSETNVLILGWDGWDTDDLDESLRSHAGETLLVYSQEMAFRAIAFGDDLYSSLAPNELIAIAGDHPALRYLMDLGFDWPSAAVIGYGGGSLSINFGLDGAPEEGVLSLLGYHVGRSGLATPARRAILQSLFESTELRAGSGTDAEAYIAQWSVPTSPRRLQKMAQTLRGLADLNRRKRYADMSEAIEDWESDLAWLKAKYYDSDPKMRFQWPSSSVPS